jgi:hypothetical protein
VGLLVEFLFIAALANGALFGMSHVKNDNGLLPVT